METNALVLGLAVLTLGVAGSGIAAPPKDPCSLLMPAEIQAVTPGANIGVGVSSVVSKELGTFACVYKWGSGGNAVTGAYYLNVTMSDVSKTFPGTSPDMVKIHRQLSTHKRY
jgi:hypothetical protein